jgi:hypothetical protein
MYRGGLPTRRSKRNSLQAKYEEELRTPCVSDATTPNCSKPTRDLLVDPIVQILFKKKLSSPNHILPRNFLTSMYTSYKLHFPWLTMAMLKGRLKRLYRSHKERSLSLSPSPTPNSRDNANNVLLASTSTPSSRDNASNALLASTSTPSSRDNANNVLAVPNSTYTPRDNASNALAITNSTHTSRDNASNVLATSDTRTKGGRPIGTTIANKSLIKKCCIAAMAEITQLYREECVKAASMGKNRVSRGTYKRVHEQVKKQRNLPADFIFPYNNCKKRIQRNTSIDHDGATITHQSPLRDCEDDIVELLIQLGKIGSPITCGTALHLINELIDDTIHQERLINWKKTQGIIQEPERMKKVGSAYWYSFLRRNSERISTKRGRKFELDRSNWTKYRNFLSMYEDIEEELVQAGLAVKLDPPIWMDEKGSHVEEEKSVGMKVKTKLLRPEMCIVMDEVGCNINMTKDGHVNGTKFVVARKDEAKQKASKKERHFTCLGLTNLTGVPIMCVVIVDGRNDDLLVRTGVDMQCHSYTNEKADGEDEDDVFMKNMGKGLLYPCGPTCEYEGKTIPCMVEFNPGGGITATILTNILKTLDKLSIFSRKNGVRPFVLLDGHSTRFDIQFLEYINSPEHRWSVCIGVPYGTSLWQVGDSVHQNGQFKVKVTLKKEQILEARSVRQMGLELLPTDIIPIVNYAWCGSFDNVTNNIKAILERGWNPLNRMLLLHPELRKSMTLKDFEEEEQGGLLSNKNRVLCKCKNQLKLPNMDTTTFNTDNMTRVETTTNNKRSLQFKGPTATRCLKKIVQEHDFERAREQIIEDKKDGMLLRERIFSLPRATAARLIINGKTHVLGEDLRDYVKENVEIKREADETKRLNRIKIIQKERKEHDQAIQRNKDKNSLMQWNLNDLKAVLKFEKTKEDGKMPSKKKAVAEMYAKCMARKGSEVVIEAAVGVIVQNEEATDTNEHPRVENDDTKTAV